VENPPGNRCRAYPEGDLFSGGKLPALKAEQSMPEVSGE